MVANTEKADSSFETIPGASIDSFRDIFHVNWVDKNDLGKLLTAQSYRSEIIEAVHKIKSLSPWKTLKETCSGKIIPGKGPEYAPSGVPCLKTKNVKRILIDSTVDEYVSTEYAESNTKLRVSFGSVLMNLSGSGSLGRTGIYLKDDFPMTNQHLVRFEVSPPFDSAYVATFLSTWWGERLIEQGISGSTGQLWINQDQLREIPIPLFDENIQRAIGNKVRKAERLKGIANYNLMLAQEQLSKVLLDMGLKNTNHDDKSVDAERDNFHASFIGLSQLDNKINATAYRPDVVAVIESLRTLKKTVRLGDITNSKIQQGDTPCFAVFGPKCLKIKNVESVFVDTKDTDYVSYDFANTNNDSKVQYGTLLITRQGVGSIGRCGVLLDGGPIFISDSLFKVEINDDNDPCCIALYLSSWIGKRLIERGIQGSTGQLTLSQKHIQNLIIPIIDKEIQVSIGDKVRFTYICRNDACKLIEDASRCVTELINGELDVQKVMAENDEIVKWFEANPNPINWRDS